MKNVTDAFKAAQASPSSVSIRRVSYKRRYWQQSTQSYIWETNWTTLSEADVVSVSAITAKLDTEAVNEFKISNLTITLKNADRRWTPTNPFGRFGKDTTSPLFGYEPFWTKFRVETGYVVGGVDTYVPLFVGVAVDFQTAGHSDTMQVSVQGLEALLKNANAEDAGTLVENETPTGTVNGTNKDFVTIQPGVGLIYKVTVDGVEKKAGTQYSISDLDTPTLGAKITFETAPTGGQVVKVWYRYWKQNQSIESLVKDLLTTAGFTQSQWDVGTVVFPGAIINSWLQTTQSDFVAGTHYGTTATESPGDVLVDWSTTYNTQLLDDFSDGNFTSNPTWTTYGAGASTYSVVSNALRSSVNASTPSQDAYIHTPSTNAFGGWSFKFRFSKVMRDIGVYFICNSLDQYNINSYVLILTSGGYSIYLVENEGGLILRKTGSYNFYENTDYTVRIARYNDNTIKVFINDVFVGKTNSAQIDLNTSVYFLIRVYGTGSNPNAHYVEFDDIRIPGSSFSAEFISQTLDMGSTPTSFPPMVINDYKLSGTTISYYSRTSANGSTWDAYEPITSGGNINSTKRRYIQIKAAFVEEDFQNKINDFTLYYLTSTALVKMAKFTGKTVYDAISSLGKFSNNEWGFGADEIFFFRSKDVTKTIDQTFDSSINLIDAGSINNGESRVYDEVKAEYGNFSVTSTPGTGFPLSPTHRYGKKRMEVSNEDILLKDDTDVATGIAQGLINYYSKPRRTCKAKTKLMEWVDLSDTVSVTYRDQPNNWWMGDTQVYFGQTDIYLHGPEANTLDGFLAKVVGYRHDTENKTSEFDLEEILQ